MLSRVLRPFSFGGHTSTDKSIRLLENSISDVDVSPTHLFVEDGLEAELVGGAGADVDGVLEGEGGVVVREEVADGRVVPPHDDRVRSDLHGGEVATRGRRGRARRRGGHDRLVLFEPAGTDVLTQVHETHFRVEPQVLRLPQRLELLVEEREDPEGLGDAARLRQQVEQEFQILWSST